MEKRESFLKENDFLKQNSNCSGILHLSTRTIRFSRITARHFCECVCGYDIDHMGKESAIAANDSYIHLFVYRLLDQFRVCFMLHQGNMRGYCTHTQDFP